MTEDGKQFDVAISFLFGDEKLAVQIYEELAATLKVFVFSKEQESLAGESGIEVFREVFRSNSRLVVVLFRQGWGETRWTRIEKLAIEERFLSDGPTFLLFVMLEREGVPPRWLPETRIRLNLADYGYEQLIGAIKHRSTVLGATPAPDDMVAHARKLTKDLAARAEKERLFHLHEGVNAATAEAERIFGEMSEAVAQIAKDTPELHIVAAGKGSQFVITNREASLHMSWYRQYGNVMGTARLTVWEMNGAVPLPPSSGTVWPEPVRIAQHQFFPDYTANLRFCWRDEAGNYLTSHQVAKWCFIMFLKLVDRKQAGELPDLDE